MFTEFEERILSCGYFDIIYWGDAWIELMSQDTKHYWIMKKFDKEGYPGLVLYHSHNGDNYHVHFVYEDTDAMPAVSEIMSHDRYFKKKMKLRNKITQVSNRKLLMEVCR